MYSFNTHESFSVIFKLSQHIESRKQYTKYQYVDYESICIKNMHTYRKKYSVLILPRWMRLWVFNFLIPFSKIRMLLLLLSRFSRVRLCATHRQQPTRLPRPWDSPGKNTGVGCHFLLQCMKVKSESEVTQSYLTLSDPMDCSTPGSSVHGTLQVKEYWSGVPLPSLK